MKLWHGADYNYEQWLDRPEVLNQDFAAMKAANCNVMTVGVFSWANYEPREGEFHFEWMDTLLDRLHRQGMKAILATPSGARPAWLSTAYPEVLRVDVLGHRAHHSGRHNHCRTSPIYREKAAQLNDRLAERYGNHPALALWHVSNEYNGGSCYCGPCLTAFRSWLQERYKTLEVLNQKWWTTFWSHRFSSWDEIYPDDSSVNGMMLDWARFTSEQTIDFYRAETAPLRRRTPQVPITTNFHGPHVGLDYFAFAKEVDVVSWDNYPTWHTQESDTITAVKTAFLHDLYRSMKGKSFLMMESTPSQTNWQGISPLKRPGMHKLASIQAIAHGSNSVQYFQWRQSRGGEEKFHGAVLSHQSSMNTRTFQDVVQVGHELQNLDSVYEAAVESEVALVTDFENKWAIDLAQLPQSTDKRYEEELQLPYEVLWKRGISTDIVDTRPRDWGRFKLILAPMLYLVREDLADQWKPWVEQGGTLVLTYLSGYVDDNDLCFEGGAPGPLSSLAGLRVEETDALSPQMVQSFHYRGNRFPARHYADLILPTAECETVAVYDHEFYSGRPVLTCRKLGKGSVWYLATRSDSAFWSAFLADRCADAGVAPAVPWPIPEGVSVRRRGNTIFVMNFHPHEVAFSIGSGGEVIKLSGYGFQVLQAP